MGNLSVKQRHNLTVPIYQALQSLDQAISEPEGWKAKAFALEAIKSLQRAQRLASRYAEDPSDATP